jgi:glutamine---fructose-6-phosphate transaminase (isomerizing)
MCGISGYVGEKNAIPFVLEGISHLEYRGYDSSGVAAICGSSLFNMKRVGKVAVLQDEINKNQVQASLAIAHTRWATHGAISEANAHPQFDQHMACAVVHNGIIENEKEIRNYLREKGVIFRSDTDTEVISQLIGFYYDGDLLQAVKKTLEHLDGAFAIAVIHQDHPDELICAAQQSPLAIGRHDQGHFVASDVRAFSRHSKHVHFLHSQEIARLTPKGLELFSLDLKESEPRFGDVPPIESGGDKEGHDHYMHKEIFEQPTSISRAFASRLDLDLGSTTFEEFALDEKELKKIERIVILACGTSYHAGLVASLMLEEKARIPTNVEISSEFRYRNPIVQENTLVIAISQSGETADTLAAMRELQEKGAKIVGICNVSSSTLAREVDHCLHLRAGPEIGVASTKAFTSQLVVLYLLAIKLSRTREMSHEQGSLYIRELQKLPEMIESILAREDEIIHMAERFHSYHNFFFLGRRYMFPTALEGALKLKEIAYVNANGYAAGEMKHGPIALIDDQCPTFAFCCDRVTERKMESSLREILTRGGKVFSVGYQEHKALSSLCEQTFFIPSIVDELAAIPATIVSQLFAYHVAKFRNTDIDKPRNLAKSVTVE